jgi:hypothetical protein
MVGDITPGIGIIAASALPSASGSIPAAAAAAEKVVENVMKVEPMIAGIAGMFVPGLSLVQPWIVMAVPFLERALTDISTSNGGDILGAFLELMQHVSKGQPNSPVLNGVLAATTAANAAAGTNAGPSADDPSRQGSG